MGWLPDRPGREGIRLRKDTGLFPQRLKKHDWATHFSKPNEGRVFWLLRTPDVGQQVCSSRKSRENPSYVEGQEVYQKTISVCHGRPHRLHCQFLTFPNVPEPPCAMLWSSETRLLRKRKINELRWPGREGGRGLACSRLLRPVTLRHAVQPTARCSCTARETGEDRPMAALPQRSALFNKVNNLSVRGTRKAVLAQRLNGKRRSH